MDQKSGTFFVGYPVSGRKSNSLSFLTDYTASLPDIRYPVGYSVRSGLCRISNSMSGPSLQDVLHRTRRLILCKRMLQIQFIYNFKKIMLSRKQKLNFRYQNSSAFAKLLYVQEVVTHFILSYYIKWVTTSWTHSISVCTESRTLCNLYIPSFFKCLTMINKNSGLSNVKLDVVHCT